MISFVEPQTTVKKILLVEDNLLFRKVIEHALLKAGYNCVLCESATEALNMLLVETPDLILSDYDMPEMNGFDFRQAVLLNPNISDIPFVFLTSFTDNKLVLEGLNMSALDFINKETPIPVIITKLNNIIKTLENEHLRSVRELKVAAETLNVKSIPTHAPAVTGYRIFYWHKGYRGYPGGDFIDFVQADSRFCFAFLGDIMGKKWKAWFFTFGFLSYIRAAIRFCVLDQDFDLVTIVQKINKLIYLDESLQNILSSLSLLLLDTHTGEVHYTGAGDLPLVSFSRETGSTSTIQSTGLLLGLLEDGLYDKQVMTMKRGDQLAIFTDGMIDIPSNGSKKSDYPFFVEKITPYLGTPDSFGLIRQHVLDLIDDSNQMDDASIIFIEKQ
ncbi:sigma-B regulation protein RsbU (phosphoserine phosphatase) [Dyadobacter sp. BE34]|uniref:Sigma-B regulation protein RsbU (Phosphoserine phosphatase) n=1 Tax=Dyadobacter fermentans TaxID=94254 RepID=A0ABU1R0U3_9BACT|nr:MULTISPECIES: response regulator [Dyadobacter]MDR6806155.1 sigma-B regulation protein RsbU (phosphoserine phosphatase) [Dyadobacter fermentans]MDR7043896.1 sigma-B regulation protein RsbU (phosphoserine phosphatase) [Dyadobacter sp. BE242]MDR7198207.1 sigma-B regulation protein RsbU (phosphoserine phosphatase) [Dyadobacter sp. BE34]MDR7216170.1 sigma-B regulation protein RsbU (phosphoserine phosphatase) [Dyadobacter sp. BE31]MDR7264304.1 sigma-B regulation protein RsbU (phosphoserine phosph